MLKGLNRLWLRGLVRAGKLQWSQATRLLKRLLVKPKPKIRVKPKLRPGKPAWRVGSRNPGRAYEIRDFYLHKKLLLRVTNKIDHLEHAWRGGDGRLTFNSTAGLDVSKMMLDFFTRHRRINTPLILF